jgi:hypothetical protein
MIYGNNTKMEYSNMYDAVSIVYVQYLEMSPSPLSINAAKMAPKIKKIGRIIPKIIKN